MRRPHRAVVDFALGPCAVRPIPARCRAEWRRLRGPNANRRLWVGVAGVAVVHQIRCRHAVAASVCLSFYQRVHRFTKLACCVVAQHRSTVTSYHYYRIL